MNNMALVLESKINEEKPSVNGQNTHKLVTSERTVSTVAGYDMATTNGNGKCMENGTEKNHQHQNEKTMLKQSQSDVKTPVKLDSKPKDRHSDGK